MHGPPLQNITSSLLYFCSRFGVNGRVRYFRIMTERKLHGLPVTDSNGTLLGILLAADVMRDLLHVVRNLPPAALVPDDVLSA